ncbi:MAG TPA: hypothetical protein VD837_13295 [Terriglobales bacterium]|nr:hypothetical protein [Terriglobales bacterium]
MRLTIDNADGCGPVDYSAYLDSNRAPQIQRKLNRPSSLSLALLATTSAFVVPALRARIIIERSDGAKLFTGYVTASPDYDYLGWGEGGPVYRYTVSAQSDEYLLDSKVLPERAAFICRSAGDIVAACGGRFARRLCNAGGGAMRHAALVHSGSAANMV